MTDPMMEVDTPRCVTCGLGGTVTVPRSEYMALRIGVLHIQDAMPTTPVEVREQIMTGLHPTCHMPGCLCPPVCGECGKPMGQSWNDGCEGCADHHWECEDNGDEPTSD